MNARLLLLPLLLCAAMSTSALAGKPDRVVNYELQVYRLDGAFRTKTSLSADMKADEEKLRETKGAVTLFNEGQFDWAGEQLKLNHRGCFWNGKKLTFEEGHREQLPFGKIKMIYSPTVAKPLGELIRLKIESDTPFQYMERKSDATFELNEVTLPVGMDLEVRAKENPKGGFHVEHLQIGLRSIGSREQVSGVSLPIGKPRIRKWNYDLTFNAGARKGYGILVRPEGTTGAMLIRIAISERK